MMHLFPLQQVFQHGGGVRKMTAAPPAAGPAPGASACGRAPRLCTPRLPDWNPRAGLVNSSNRVNVDDDSSADSDCHHHQHHRHQHHHHHHHHPPPRSNPTLTRRRPAGSRCTKGSRRSPGSRPEPTRTLAPTGRGTSVRKIRVACIAMHCLWEDAPRVSRRRGGGGGGGGGEGGRGRWP